jgi:hypothetical protein
MGTLMEKLKGIPGASINVVDTSTKAVKPPLFCRHFTEHHSSHPYWYCRIDLKREKYRIPCLTRLKAFSMDILQVLLLLRDEFDWVLYVGTLFF